MQALLWRESGLSINSAKLIFSGYKIDQSISAIKKIYESKNKKIDDALERVFQQTGIINGERNFIVHYGAKITPEGLMVTNKTVSFKGRKIRSFPVSPEILEQMKTDLKNIHMILLLYKDRKNNKGEYFKQAVDYFSKNAFLYKSAPQENTNRKTHKNTRKH